MQKIELLITNAENVGLLSEPQVIRIQEILTALLTSGGLTGVKGGKTILHFDADGLFMGVQLDYMPWRRRRG